jgi:NADH:ubiquinone oxidoreductase subunit H
MFILEILIPILSVLICVAYYTLAERKIIASIQRRQGPNVVGVLGLLQPIIDGVKAVLKEQITPLRGIIFLFILAPFLCFFISLLLLNFLSFSYTRGYFDEYLNMILFLSISSFNIFGLIFAG